MRSFLLKVNEEIQIASLKLSLPLLASCCWHQLTQNHLCIIDKIRKPNATHNLDMMWDSRLYAMSMFY